MRGWVVASLADLDYGAREEGLRRPGRWRFVTRWTVEATGDDKLGFGRTYSVVKIVDGRRELVRARWVGLSCIDAQVIAAELNSAYELGGNDTRKNIYAILSDD